MIEKQPANSLNATAPSLVAVSHDELRLVDGGSFISKVKWVLKHVYVDLKNHVIGIKG
jgi:hypothetical protein